ncbi:MAG: hypothetical protein MHM6MM_001793 [Cercozoa sp. M6MM]
MVVARCTVCIQLDGDHAPALLPPMRLDVDEPLSESAAKIAESVALHRMAALPPTLDEDHFKLYVEGLRRKRTGPFKMSQTPREIGVTSVATRILFVSIEDPSLSPPRQPAPRVRFSKQHEEERRTLVSCLKKQWSSADETWRKKTKKRVRFALSLEESLLDPDEHRCLAVFTDEVDEEDDVWNDQQAFSNIIVNNSSDSEAEQAQTEGHLIDHIGVTTIITPAVTTTRSEVTSQQAGETETQVETETERKMRRPGRRQHRKLKSSTLRSALNLSSQHLALRPVSPSKQPVRTQRKQRLHYDNNSDSCNRRDSEEDSTDRIFRDFDPMACVTGASHRTQRDHTEYTFALSVFGVDCTLVARYSKLRRITSQVHVWRQLDPLLPSQREFPPKKWFGNMRPSFVQERCRALSKYIDLCLRSVDLVCDRRFLNRLTVSESNQSVLRDRVLAVRDILHAR